MISFLKTLFCSERNDNVYRLELYRWGNSRVHTITVHTSGHLNICTTINCTNADQFSLNPTYKDELLRILSDYNSIGCTVYKNDELIARTHDNEFENIINTALKKANLYGE